MWRKRLALDVMRMKVITREWEREKENILTLYSIRTTPKYTHLCESIREISNKLRDSTIRSYYKAEKAKYIKALAEWAYASGRGYNKNFTKTITLLKEPEAFNRINTALGKNEFTPENKVETPGKDKFKPKNIERRLMRSLSQAVTYKKNEIVNDKIGADTTKNPSSIRQLIVLGKAPKFIYCPIKEVMQNLICNAAKNG